MSMAVGPKGGQNANMNVTPLIDVLLVLLIIFMVITPIDAQGIGSVGAAAAAEGCEDTAALHRSHDCGAVDRPRRRQPSGTQDQSG